MSELLAGTALGAPDINVKMVCRNVRTGKVTNTIETHNRFLKNGIYGLVRFLNGEFNNTTPEQLKDYIPRYFALGSNLAHGDSGGVTTEVTVNDTRLLSELDHPRSRLVQRNIITNRYSDPFIKLTIKHYIPVTAYVGESLAEAGLFTNETGNNAIARIVFDRFVKDSETVIDVTWEITIVSIASEKEAYVITDKADLYDTIKSSIETIGTNYSHMQNLCQTISDAVTVYSRSDASQATVDAATRAMQEAIDPFPLPDEYIPVTQDDYNRLLDMSEEIMGEDSNGNAINNNEGDENNGNG